MSKLCGRIQQLTQHVKVININEMEYMKKHLFFLRYKNKKSSKEFEVRRCQLMSENPIEEIFVLAPPNRPEYMPVKDRILLIRCQQEECFFYFSIIIPNFHEEYPRLSSKWFLV